MKIPPILLIIFCLSCTSKEITSAKRHINSYNFDDGIFIERNIYDNLTENNKVYRFERKFTFKYDYFDRKGNQVFFDIPSFEKRQWNFYNTEISDTSNGIVYCLEMRIEFGAKSENLNNQTSIKWSNLDRYGNALDSTWTGLVENDKNCWIHPPRRYAMSILELNPFPHVQYPLELKRKWWNEITVGEGWGDARWKEWEGPVLLHAQYEVIDHIEIPTKLGTMKCWKIRGISKSRIGTTELISYYNEDIGFTRLEYRNIDSSSIILSLVSIQ